jgi:hypothetical protein
MLHLISSVLLLISITAQASQVIKKPRLNKSIISCESNADLLCRLYGFEKAVADSKICKYMKPRIFRTSFECQLERDSNAYDAPVVSVVKNDYGRMPTIWEAHRRQIIYANLETLIVPKFYNGCTQIIKEIECE